MLRIGCSDVRLPAHAHVCVGRSLGNPPYFFYPPFNIFLVAMKYCMTVVASQNAWGEWGGVNSIILAGFSTGLAYQHFNLQPCLGGPSAASINALRCSVLAHAHYTYIYIYIYIYIHIYIYICM